MLPMARRRAIDACECNDLAAANAEACRLFAELVRYHPDITHGDELCVKVADHTGLALFDLTLLVTEAPVLRAR